MKKVLFLQIKGNSLGGIWFVNKTLGEEFLNRSYDVRVLGIRNNHPGVDIDSKIKIDVINKTYTPKQALKEVKKIVSKKINSQLNDKEFIIKQKNLKITPKDSKIIVETFVSVYEDITDYKEITEPGDDNV